MRIKAVGAAPITSYWCNWRISVIPWSAGSVKSYKIECKSYLLLHYLGYAVFSAMKINVAQMHGFVDDKQRYLPQHLETA